MAEPSTIAIVCHCPRCDYFVKSAVQPRRVGNHGCAQCGDFAQSVKHIGGGVWVAVLHQDAMEDIAHYLPFGARHSTGARRVFDLGAMFKDALEAAFPDGAQDPVPSAIGGDVPNA